MRVSWSRCVFSFWTISSFISSASASVLSISMFRFRWLKILACIQYTVHVIYIYIYLFIVLYIHVHPEFGGTFPVSSYVFYRRAIVCCPCCAYSQLKTRLTGIFQASCSFGCLVRGTEKNTALSLSTLAAGFRWFSRIRPYWKQTPASLRGAPFTTEPWLFKANLGCLEVNFFDYVDSAIDVCLSLDVICSLISIGSHGSLVPSIAGLP